jgi:hypothetical protein
VCRTISPEGEARRAVYFAVFLAFAFSVAGFLAFAFSVAGFLALVASEAFVSASPQQRPWPGAPRSASFSYSIARS